MSEEILESNTKIWTRRLLKRELIELEREQLHLKTKRVERVLTEWELERVAHIMDEIMELLGQFGHSHQLGTTRSQPLSADFQPLFA